MQHQASQAADRLIRISEVKTLAGICESTIYAKILKNEFPAPVKIGLRASRWRLSAINEWLANPR